MSKKPTKPVASKQPKAIPFVPKRTESPPHIYDEQPLPLAPSARRSNMHRELLRSAGWFREHGNTTSAESAMMLIEQMGKCGHILIDSFTFNLLPTDYPELADLVRYHQTAPAEAPERGPRGLFVDICGCTDWRVVREHQPASKDSKRSAAARMVVVGFGPGRGLMLRWFPYLREASDVEKWSAACEWLASLLAGQPAGLADETLQYVTLDQIAATVHQKKDTLSRKKNLPGSTMPEPDHEGGGGKPDKWIWSKIRPWLENEYKMALPERYPSLTGF